MIKIKNIFLLIITPVLFFACSLNNEDADIEIAKVSNKILYLSEITEFVPKGLSKEDSTLMAENYINQWIKKQLLIQKAEENLTLEQKDISKEIEEYRNSLIIYNYQKELINQKMDTLISNNEIEQYYYANNESFILNNNIVKAIYLKIPEEIADPEMLKNYCDDNSEESLNELTDYCLRYAKSFDIFTDEWTDFRYIVENIPEDIENQEQFLTQNNMVESYDSIYYYLVCIYDYRLAGQPAPVEHVSENIKSLIINKRKIDFLKNIETEIYEEGIRNNKFKIYNY